MYFSVITSTNISSEYKKTISTGHPVKVFSLVYSAWKSIKYTGIESHVITYLSV